LIENCCLERRRGGKKRHIGAPRADWGWQIAVCGFQFAARQAQTGVCCERAPRGVAGEIALVWSSLFWLAPSSKLPVWGRSLGPKCWQMARAKPAGRHSDSLTFGQAAVMLHASDTN